MYPRGVPVLKNQAVFSIFSRYVWYIFLNSPGVFHIGIYSWYSLDIYHTYFWYSAYIFNICIFSVFSRYIFRYIFYILQMWWINQDCQSVRRFWLSGNFQYDGQLSIYCDLDEDDDGGYDNDEDNPLEGIFCDGLFWDHPSSSGELVVFLKIWFLIAKRICKKYQSQLLQPEIALFANSSSDSANSLFPNFRIQISDWKRSDPRKFEWRR